MSRILIKVEKDDIKTSKSGNNIMIQCDNNIDLIFTPEALKEIINDYNNIVSDVIGSSIPNPPEPPKDRILREDGKGLVPPKNYRG
jgi:hypothetical protein